MASRVDACEVEGDELLQNLLPFDSRYLVWLSLCLSLGDQSIVLPHLVDVNLNEILVWIIANCQPCIEDLVDDPAYLNVLIVEIFVLFGNDSLKYFSQPINLD